MPKDPQQEGQGSAKLALLERLTTGVRDALGWAKQNRLRAAVVLGACLLSVAGMIIGWLAIASQLRTNSMLAAEEVLETLDSGAYQEAREMAEKLEKQGTLGLDELGVPPFVLGAAAAYQGDDTWSSDKTAYYLLASRHLEEARDRGFPSGRHAEGQYLLGRTLYLSGQIPASRPFLISALKLNKNKATEIHRLLAGAYLNDPNPKLHEALAENTLYLGDRKLAREFRHAGFLERAQIMLRLGKMAECKAALAKIPSNAANRADAIILRGRVLMHEARELKAKPDPMAEDLQQARQKYREAIKVLIQAQGRDTLSTQATRKAMYLIGQCYLQREEYRAALAQFGRIRRLHPETPEALAASFQEGELARQFGRNNEAVAEYRRALGAVSDPDNFKNPWITLDELRHGMLAAYQDYLENRSFELSLRMTASFYPLFSRQRTLQLTGNAHRTWGNSLLTQAEHLPHEKAQQVARQGRAQLRQAGLVYSRLAKFQMTSREYPDQLWRSATAYFRGQNYSETLRILREYLDNESRRKRPQALVMQGRAYLALNKTDKALTVLEECIAFHPRDVASSRARLCVANVYLEKGEPQKAEQALSENLNNDVLNPRSQEWRSSLFALGELYYQQQRHQEAVEVLEEAVLRYPDDPRALDARYQMADAYRRGAEAAYDKLKADLPEGEPPAPSRQVQQDFDQALVGYREVEDILNRQQELAPLSPMQKIILRNSRFMIADVLFDLARYDQAVQQYFNITNRYQNQPEVLTAYHQIIHAYRRLGKYEEMRTVLKRAQTALSRMNENTQFTETTNYDAQQWGEVLDSLSQL